MLSQFLHSTLPRNFPSFLLSCLNHNLSLPIFYSFIPSRLTFSLYINSHSSVIPYSSSLSALFWLRLTPYKLWTPGLLLTIPNNSQDYCPSDLPLCLAHQRELPHFIHPNTGHLSFLWGFVLWEFLCISQTSFLSQPCLLYTSDAADDWLVV